MMTELIFCFVLKRDEAIELADRALTMPKEERIEEFSELLKDAADQSKSCFSKKI